MRFVYLPTGLALLGLLAATSLAAEPRYSPPPYPGYLPQIVPLPPAPRIEIPPPPPRSQPTPPPLPLPLLRRHGGTSFPGGMTITVTKLLHDDRDKDVAPSTAPIDRPKQAADQLAACWSPPLPPKGDTVEITLKFSFNGRGEIMGAPRTPYVKAAPGISADTVRESLRAAIKTCSPLRFTKSMAASAPGYPLSVRFIARRAGD